MLVSNALRRRSPLAASRAPEVGWSAPIRLATLGLGLYAASIPIVNNVLVPAPVRLALFNQRPYVIVAIVVVPLLAMAFAGSRRLARVAADPVLRALALLAFAFPLWFACVTLARGTESLPVMGLYGLWALVSFVLAPALVQSIGELRAMLRVFAAVAVLDLAAGALLSATGDVGAAYPTLRRVGLVPVLGEALPLGFMNANYYAQIPQVLFAALAFDRFVLRRGPRLVTDLGMALAVALVLLTWSRNVLVFLTAMGLCTLLLRRGHVGKAALGVLLLLGALAATVLVLESRFDDMDRYATGRLQLWSYLIDQVYSGDSPVGTFTFGAAEVPAWPGIPSYDPLASAKEFTKLHVDNFYLELMFEGGAVGLLLFLAPYAAIAGYVISRIDRGPEERRLAAWALGILLGLAFQGLFISTIPTLGSPLGFFYALTAVAPVSAVNRRARR